jgi:hypothetical protein
MIGAALRHWGRTRMWLANCQPTMRRKNASMMKLKKIRPSQQRRCVKSASQSAVTRGRDHVCVLSAATGGDLARSRRWRECAQPAGMGDELRAAVVDDHGCWGSFEALRASDDPPFDAEDAHLMRDAARIPAGRLRQASVSATDDRGVDAAKPGCC